MQHKLDEVKQEQNATMELFLRLAKNIREIADNGSQAYSGTKDKTRTLQRLANKANKFADPRKFNYLPDKKSSDIATFAAEVDQLINAERKKSSARRIEWGLPPKRIDLTDADIEDVVKTKGKEKYIYLKTLWELKKKLIEAQRCEQTLVKLGKELQSSMPPSSARTVDELKRDDSLILMFKCYMKTIKHGEDFKKSYDELITKDPDEKSRVVFHFEIDSGGVTYYDIIKAQPAGTGLPAAHVLPHRLPGNKDWGDYLSESKNIFRRQQQRHIKHQHAGVRHFFDMYRNYCISSQEALQQVPALSAGLSFHPDYPPFAPERKEQVRKGIGMFFPEPLVALVGAYDAGPDQELVQFLKGKQKPDGSLDLTLEDMYHIELMYNPQLEYSITRSP